MGKRVKLSEIQIYLDRIKTIYFFVIIEVASKPLLLFGQNHSTI